MALTSEYARDDGSTTCSFESIMTQVKVKQTKIVLQCIDNHLDFFVSNSYGAQVKKLYQAVIEAKGIGESITTIFTHSIPI